jgi:hypothetical protein
LNVPRLDEFAALRGVTISHDDIADGVSLNQLGYRLNGLMSAYRRTLGDIEFDALPVGSIQFVHEAYLGKIVRFDRERFRTKNMPLYRPSGDAVRFTGDEDFDPHIYRRTDAWKLVINIDPRWITTSTAYSMFRPSGGASVFSGFARITHVNYENSTMTATALAIGVPSGPTDLQSIVRNISNARLSLLRDDETISRGREYHDEIPKCDLCRHTFVEGDYMVDGPMFHHGPWANMCADCYGQRGFPFGVGLGQLYQKVGDRWPMVAGSPEPDEPEY